MGQSVSSKRSKIAKDHAAACAGGIRRAQSGADFDDDAGDAERSVARIDGENSIFSRREPARRETGLSPHYWEPAEQNRLKPCRGKPFHLWKELKFESQKGNSR